MNTNQSMYTSGCSKQEDKTNLSRRSIDWRDSGIVIDEDDHLFGSICNFDSQSSIGLTSSAEFRGAQPQHHSIASPKPVQNIALRRDEDGDTILHLAVVGFTLERTKDLISVSDLNAINNMVQTPLHVATLANRPEMVNLLVKSNAKLDVYDRRGNTPLHLACQKGLTSIVEILLDSIPDSSLKTGSLTRDQAIKTCNFEGFTCLHLAAMNSHNNITELLISKYNADLTARDSKSGETILHKAVRHLNVDLVGYILKHNQHNLLSLPDYSHRVPQETIKALKESSLTTQSQDDLQKLLKIEQMIQCCVNECAIRGGCCLGRDKLVRQSLNFADAASSSSSDYSDSE